MLLPDVSRESAATTQHDGHSSWLSSVCCMAIAGCAGLCLTYSDLSARVYVATIRRIRLGQSRAEVEALLGPPQRCLESPGSGQHDPFVLLDYGTPVLFARWSPLLRITLTNSAVSFVSATRHSWNGNEDVYQLSTASVTERRSLFEETFP